MFSDRVHWLKSAIKKIQGRPPLSKKSKIDGKIVRLQELASEILIHQIFKKESKSLIKQKKRWHITKNKGWGRTEKKKSFKNWFNKYIDYNNYVYIFWNGKECIYVGRSVAGKTRPQNHFEKYWFNVVTRIDIYSTSQKSQVPKLECLCIHYYKPKININTASKRSYSKHCPICDTKDNIRKEIKSAGRIRLFIPVKCIREKASIYYWRLSLD